VLNAAFFSGRAIRRGTSSYDSEGKCGDRDPDSAEAFSMRGAKLLPTLGPRKRFARVAKYADKRSPRKDCGIVAAALRSEGRAIIIPNPQLSAGNGGNYEFDQFAED
jgi:hypothetical protein